MTREYGGTGRRAGFKIRSLRWCGFDSLYSYQSKFMNILRQLYEWTLKKSEHPKASWFLSIISFTESYFFPIPPDIILIPMVIAKTAKAWTYAFICTVSWISTTKSTCTNSLLCMYVIRIIFCLCIFSK